MAKCSACLHAVAVLQRDSAWLALPGAMLQSRHSPARPSPEPRMSKTFRLLPGLVAGLSLLLATPAFAAKVYQWKDEKGVTHYSDSPAAGAGHQGSHPRRQGRHGRAGRTADGQAGRRQRQLQQRAQQPVRAPGRRRRRRGRRQGRQARPQPQPRASAPIARRWPRRRSRPIARASPSPAASDPTPQSCSAKPAHVAGFVVHGPPEGPAAAWQNGRFLTFESPRRCVCRSSTSTPARKPPPRPKSSATS